MERFPQADVRGYILAGGQSRRMGQDKAFVLLSGKPLIQIAVEQLEECCAEIRILSGASSFDREALLRCYAHLVADGVGASGPVAGVLAALQDARTGWCLVAAVDQPFLPVGLLMDWLQAALDDPRISASWLFEAPGQELCPRHLPVLLHTRLLPALSRIVQGGERQLMRTIECAIQQESLEFFAFPGKQAEAWSLNLNTPADVDRAQRILDASPAEPNGGGSI